MKYREIVRVMWLTTIFLWIVVIIGCGSGSGNLNIDVNGGDMCAGTGTFGAILSSPTITYRSSTQTLDYFSYYITGTRCNTVVTSLFAGSYRVNWTNSFSSDSLTLNFVNTHVDPYQFTAPTGTFILTTSTLTTTVTSTLITKQTITMNGNWVRI